jgi:phage-related protein
MAESKILDIVIRLKDEFSKNISSMKEQLGKTANTAGVAGLAIGGFGLALAKSSINEAMEGERAIAGLNQVIKSTKGAAGLTAESVVQMGNSLAKQTGIADDAVISGQNMLLTFTNIGSKVFPQTTETMLDMATAMNNGVTPTAEQLKGTAIQLGKALNNPTEGISALSRVGVAFTQTQKDMIEKLQTSGDIMGAQKVILGELATEFGGQATAQAQTFSGKIGVLTERFNGVKETMGQALMPVLMIFVGYLEKMATWLEQNKSFVEKIIPFLLILAGALGSLKVVSVVIGIFSSIASAVSLLIPFIVTLIATFGWWLLIIPLIIGAGVLIYKNWELIKTKALELWEYVKTTISNFWAWIQPYLITALRAVLFIFTGGLSELALFIFQNWEMIKAKAKEIWDGMVSFFSSIWESIRAKTKETWDGIVSFFTTTFTEISNFFKLIWGGITTFFSDTWEKIKTSISTAINFVKETVSLGFKIIVDSIISIFTPIITFISNAFNSIISTIGNGIKTITGVISGVVSIISTPFINAFKAIYDSAKSIFGGIGDLIKGAIGAVTGAFDKVKGFLGKAKETASKVTGLQFANGGIVPKYYAGGGFASRGTDTVPAMLTPGELILNEAQQKNVANGLSSNGGINISISGNSFQGTAREMADQIGELLIGKVKANFRI